VTAYKNTKWRTLNESYFRGQGHCMIWRPPHFKISIGRTDETNERALAFLKESHDFFADLNAQTLNTFSMTKAVANFLCLLCNWNTFPSCEYLEQRTCKRSTVTYDGFHYTRQIDLWKARLVLNLFRKLAESGIQVPLVA
jgi:hypothetical protein